MTRKKKEILPNLKPLHEPGIKNNMTTKNYGKILHYLTGPYLQQESERSMWRQRRETNIFLLLTRPYIKQESHKRQ